MPTHNDMAAMLPEMSFDSERPTFYLLNVGETHYPYALPDEDPDRWPRISGVHGVFKGLDEGSEDQPHPTEPASSPGCSTCSPTTPGLSSRRTTASSSARDQYFGHGPIAHEKVLEVPFVEGLAP
jgi:hypothetical protein